MRRLLIVTLLASSACSAESVEPAPAQTAESASAAFAKAFCERIFECTPGWAARRTEGTDLASCTKVRTNFMLRSLRAPGSSKTFPKLTKCVAELRSVTCQDFHDIHLAHDYSAAPDCMRLDPGTLEDAAPCLYSTQCKSGLCSSNEGQCGQCVAFGGEGEPCPGAIDTCDTTKGLVCDRTLKCVRVPRRGEACTELCAGWTECKGTSRKCGNLHEVRGEPCDPLADDCDLFGHALVCNNRSNTCERLEVAMEGEPCGLGIPSGGFAECGAGLLCDMSTPTTINAYSGRCVRGTIGGAGEGCVETGGKFHPSGCALGLSCNKGTCAPDDYPTCK